MAAGGGHFLREFFCFVCFVLKMVEITVSFKLCQAPVATVASHHKLGDLKQKKCVMHSFY